MLELSMIQSFKCKDTEALWKGERVKRFESIERVAQRKLTYLNAARVLQDLAVPPGNHLEALKGDRQGQHSIRVNDQYRVCFIWSGSDALDVEIVDYH
jgi:toxin HigB-1